jgi:2-methylfumaryl-CoA isomerase
MSNAKGAGSGVPAVMLNGVTVVEISSFVAAPTAGLTLAQLGADVIRIDPVGGAPDVHRWPVTTTGRSLYWAGLNRGKSSVELDLAEPDAQQLVRQLLAAPGDGTGILVTNLAGKHWLSDPVLREARPDLLHVQVLGQRDGRSAVDYTVNAATGLPLATGPGPAPVNHALPAWDLLCGLYVAVAVLAALHRRRDSQVGTFATVSLDDVAASVLTTLGFMPEAQLTGTSRPPLGNAIYGSYGTELALADGQRIIVVALTRRHWRDLVSITRTARVFATLERELGIDLTDEGVRFQHQDLLDAVLRPWFARRTLAEVAAALTPAGVLWSPFRTLRDLAADLAAGAASPVVSLRDDAGIGTVLATAGPIRLPDEPAPSIAAAPRLGEDTALRLGQPPGGSS